MTATDHITKTVRALAHYAQTPNCYLRVVWGEHNVRYLKIETSIDWWECFLSYFGASSFNFRAIVDCLHHDGGLADKLRVENMRDRDWARVNQALDTLQEKIQRYNTCGLRPQIESLQLAPIRPIPIPVLVRSRLLNADVCDKRLTELQKKLVNQLHFSTDELDSILVELTQLRSLEPLSPETFAQIELIEDLIEAQIYCLKYPTHYCDPYRFSPAKKSFSQAHPGDNFFDIFVSFLAYVHERYTELADMMADPDDPEERKPPYKKEFTIQELRDLTADYFKEHVVKDRHLRVLIFHAMLLHNRSVQEALKGGSETISKNLDACMSEVQKVATPNERILLDAIIKDYAKAPDLKRAISKLHEIVVSSTELRSLKRGKLLESIQNSLGGVEAAKKFSDHYRYDLNDLHAAIGTYIARTKEPNRWAGLTELYALTRVFRLRVSLYKVSEEGSDGGVAEKDLHALDLFKPIDEDHALLDTTLMMLFVNREEFCLPDQEAPLSPGSARELREQAE